MMKSKDYFEGYTQGINDVLEKIKDAQKEFEVYGNRKNFKGLSKREIVFECFGIIEQVVKGFEQK